MLDPTPRLPSGGTRFWILFGRDACTNFDVLTPALDNDDSHAVLDTFMGENQQTFLELRGILNRQQEDKNRRRVRHNAAILRKPPGERAPVGGLVLVKEVDGQVAREGILAKLAHGC